MSNNSTLVIINVEGTNCEKPLEERAKRASG